ncbi:hypothetical protein ACFWIQ_05290 [Kitasatospora sp. NPDC127059]|uniref:Rv1733c family protein n=1 Tax=unclassified Kitasatospora TaxID=2633591 RepID=UPI00366602A9
MSAAAATHRHPASRTSLRGHVRRATGRDHNPLCRPLDQAYSRLVAGLAVAMLATLVTAVVAALLVYRVETHTAQQTARHQHIVTAVTTGAALPGTSRTGVREYAPAGWTYPVGPGTGSVPVPEGTLAGTPVRVSLNDAGNPVGGPRPTDLIVTDAVLAGLGTVIVLGFGAEGAAAVRRRVLDRRAERGWEASWEQVEPRWSGRR